MAAWVRVLWRDPCAYCGGPGGTVDHITAVYCGGRAEPSNLTGACPRCNLDKGAMPLLGFLLAR